MKVRQKNVLSVACVPPSPPPPPPPIYNALVTRRYKVEYVQVGACSLTVNKKSVIKSSCEREIMCVTVTGVSIALLLFAVMLSRACFGFL